MAEEAKWYVVHTYSGYENKVKANIESKKPIGPTVEVVSPTETVINVQARVSIDTSTTLEKIKEKYTKLFSDYITDNVFKIYTIDYYKCLSLLYEIEGVRQVNEFKLNNATNNIQIEENHIQSVGTITVEVVWYGTNRLFT